jgi:hypothetical protein
MIIIIIIIFWYVLTNVHMVYYYYYYHHHHCHYYCCYVREPYLHIRMYAYIYICMYTHTVYVSLPYYSAGTVFGANQLMSVQTNQGMQSIIRDLFVLSCT